MVSQADGDEDERRRADRQVDVENPAPGKRIGDDAAEQRTGHAAGGEDGAEDALVRPRSRGAMRSPMVVWDRVIRPPAPSPCSARKRMSWSMVCASPQSTEPMRKILIAMKNSGLRPYMSLSLP